jgi:hypothetical protein
LWALETQGSHNHDFWPVRTCSLCIVTSRAARDDHQPTVFAHQYAFINNLADFYLETYQHREIQKDIHSHTSSPTGGTSMALLMYTFLPLRVQKTVTRVAVEMHSFYRRREASTESGDTFGSPGTCLPSRQKSCISMASTPGTGVTEWEVGCERVAQELNT